MQSTSDRGSNPNLIKVSESSLYQSVGDCFNPYSACCRRRKIFRLSPVHPRGILQNTNLSIDEFANALTASYCQVSRSKTHVIAIKNQNRQAASVAA